MVKVIGAGYLIWIGVKIILKRNLITFNKVKKEPLQSIFITGFFTVILNPRAGIFVLAFIPQFVDPEAGSFAIQMILYGTWFAILSVLVLSLMGIFSEKMSYFLKEKPKLILALNVGAGLIFLFSGFTVANIEL